MPKYNQSEVAGESWTRSFQITGWNEIGKPPGIRFDEELAISLGGEEVLTSKLNSSVFTVLDENNATEQFQLRNPVTEEYVDAYATYQDFFVLVHSLYFHLAQKRDRGPQPYASWVWNDTDKKWEAPTPKPTVDAYWVWDEGSQVWADTRVPSPYPSWVWNSELLAWEAPASYPTDGLEYIWNEASLGWDLVGV